jgi:hypothetical protein
MSDPAIGIGKELLFDPPQAESSIPSMNVPAFSGDFSSAEVFCLQ